MHFTPHCYSVIVQAVNISYLLTKNPLWIIYPDIEGLSEFSAKHATLNVQILNVIYWKL